MSIFAGSVYGDLILKTDKFDSALKEAENKANRFSNSFESVGTKLSGVGDSMTKKITVPAVSAAAAVAGIVAAFGWKRLTGLDAAQAQLKGLGYDIEGVERISKQVSNAVQGTVMTMAEGTSTAAGALAAGVKEGEELEHYIRLVGSAAVGAGRDIDGMAMIFNRVQGSGKLMTQELNMIEDGMPGFSMAMAEHFGVSLAAFKEMVTNGEVSSAEFLVVMDDFAGGMAEAYADSWAGMVENTKSNIGILGQHLLSGVFEQSKMSIAEFLELLRSPAAREWAAEAGQSIGETFTKIIGGVKAAVEWWTNLDDGTRKAITTAGLVVVAAGPVLSTIGKFSTAIGSILGFIGPVTGGLTGMGAAATGVGTAAAGGAAGVGLLSGGLGAGVIAAAPWIAAAAAIAIGATKVGKALSEDALPGVDLFGDIVETTATKVELANGQMGVSVDTTTTKISDGTKKAVGAYLDLEKDATTSLNQLSWGSVVITEEMATELSGKYAKMKDSLVKSIDEQKEESLVTLQNMFNEQSSLTEKEQAELLELTEKRYDDEKKTAEEGYKRINEILQKASDEGREISKSEAAEIEQIKKSMKETAVRVMTESEKEQLAIMERLKQNSSQISAEQAAEVIRNSVEQKNKTIEEATKEYNERSKLAAELRADGTRESAEMADKIMKDAEQQRKIAIEEAEKMHQGVVDEAKKQAGEHAKYLDMETGDIKSKWQVMLDTVKQKAQEKYQAAIEKQKAQKEETTRLREEQRQKEAEQWNQMVTTAKQKSEEMKTAVVNKYEELKESAKQKIEQKKTDIEGIWSMLTTSADTWGGNMVRMFASGMDKAKGAVTDAANWIATKVTNLLGHHSPAKEGPMSDSDTWMPNFVNMLAEGINRNKEKVTKETEDLASKIRDSLSKVNDYVSTTVSNIQKEFELWVLENKAVEESSEYLEKQLAMQKKEHGLLNEQIKATENALKRATEKYGENSIEAIKLKGELLSLKIGYKELSNEIDETSKSLNNMKNSADSAIDALFKAETQMDRTLAKSLRTAAELEKVWKSTGTITSDDVNNALGSNFESRHGMTQEEYAAKMDIEKRRNAIDWAEGVVRRKGSNVFDSTWNAIQGINMGNLSDSDIAKLVDLRKIEIDAGRNWKGTNFWRGGWSWVGEKGPELIELPRGTKIYPHEESKKIMGNQGRGDINQTVNIYSPEPLSPYEVRRQTLRASRQLAMEWGR